MTSLIDQYKNEASITDDREKPIFLRETSCLQLPEGVLFAAVSNDHLVVALRNFTLLWYNRVETTHWNIIKEVDVNRVCGGNAPRGIFLDPSASHLLISFPNDLFYQHRKFSKPKLVGKLKGVEVTAVGWDEDGWSQATTTGPILLGTSKGAIFETEISFSGENIFAGSIELYAKQVFDLGRGQDELGICGLQWRRGGGSEGEKCFVLATTTERLYQFTGSALPPSKDPKRPLLQQMFNKYLSVHEGFQQIPSDLKYSRLELRGRMLAWLTQTGVFLAQVDTRKDDEGLLVYTRHLPLEHPPPLDILITDYHLLLLGQNSLSAVNVLSESTIFYEKLKEKLKRITKDPKRNTIWIIGETEIFGYRINKEDRNVWKIYAEKGDWEAAKNFCKEDPESLDEVRVMEADYLFDAGRFEESASCYANTNVSFEKVALKFLQAGEHQAVKSFLKLKLDKLSEGVGEKAQCTMLVIWIIELLSRKLGEEEGEAREATQAELDEFMSRPKIRRCINQNRKSIYNLLGSHGDEANLLALAKRSGGGNTAKVISHYINKGEHIKALDELVKERDTELWYKFASPLIESVPRSFFNAVIDRKPPLNPAKLFPALVAASDTQPEELMRYLQMCVLECREKAVHNLLLSLYARHNEKKLKTYLAMQGREASLVHYDIQFGARVCREAGRGEGCVELLALLGLWESSVALALSLSDVPLAKQTASLPSCPEHLQKKLWLQIAEHVVKEKNDIASAMEFLQECKEIKIEDILPFFPDFSSIDHFKDAICSSLEEYNQHIQEVKEEMEDATKSAESIRRDLLNYRKKFTEIKEGDKCDCCQEDILKRGFYMFPCSHKFHADCLASRLPPDPESGNNGNVKKDGPNSYLASQCLYCGDLALQLISKGFFEDEEYERIRQEWE